MVSEADSVSFLQSTTQGSSQSQLETKWRSPVWDYCCMANEEDDENPNFLYCTQCLPDDPRSHMVLILQQL